MIPTNDTRGMINRVHAPLKAALLLVLLVASSVVFSQKKYIKQYRPLADSLSSVYGIPSAVILGVAIVESGAGASKNAKLLNNHFGIVGKNNLLKTNGIKTRYKQYPSIPASYFDFCKIVSRRKYYTKLKGNDNWNLWVDAISKAGYSEVPEEWKKKVSTTIKKYKLSSIP